MMTPTKIVLKHMTLCVGDALFHAGREGATQFIIDEIHPTSAEVSIRQVRLTVPSKVSLKSILTNSNWLLANGRHLHLYLAKVDLDEYSITRADVYGKWSKVFIDRMFGTHEPKPKPEPDYNITIQFGDQLHPVVNPQPQQGDETMALVQRNTLVKGHNTETSDGATLTALIGTMKAEIKSLKDLDVKSKAIDAQIKEREDAIGVIVEEIDRRFDAEQAAKPAVKS